MTKVTKSQAIDWRHWLHQNPELAYREYKTSDFVREKLVSFGYDIVPSKLETCVIGRLGSAEDADGVLFRADIDALPIQEESGVPYRSKTDGIMHACGHDGHTAMLLFAAAQISNLWNGGRPFYVVFQPAEEAEGGAEKLVENGIFQDINVSEIYALHNWPGLPIGEFFCPNGPIMGAFGIFDVLVSGQGGHAAMPEHTDNVLEIGFEVAQYIQSIKSRYVDAHDPCVVNVTEFTSGSGYNVLPSGVIIKGTARWYGNKVGQDLSACIERISGKWRGSNCNIRSKFQFQYPTTNNSCEEAQNVRSVGERIGLRYAEVSSSLASEDFSFLLREKPGAYFWIGAADDRNTEALHSPAYDFNDGVLEGGASFWVALWELLNEKRSS